MLTKTSEGINVENSRKSISYWQTLLQAQSAMHSPMACSILQVMTEDVDLSEGIATGFQLLEISGKPPDAALHMFKKGPGTHSVEMSFTYGKAIRGELAKANRVMVFKHQTRVFGLSLLLLVLHTIIRFWVTQFFENEV